MNGYDLYCIYQAIKLHFTSEGYNFFQYDGKTRVSIDAFQKRRDKFLFHRLARKYRDDEMVPFLVANFVHSDDNWTKSLLEDQAEETYRDWKQTTDSMSKVYAEDLQKICSDPNKFNDLFFDVNRDGEDFDFLMKLKNLTNNWVVAPEIYYNVRH